jgi:hypothetical protein
LMNLTPAAAKVAASIKRQYPAQADAILARAEKIAAQAGRDRVSKGDVVAAWMGIGSWGRGT